MHAFETNHDDRNCNAGDQEKTQKVEVGHLKFLDVVAAHRKKTRKGLKINNYN